MGILRLYLALCVIGNHAESVLPWKIHGGQDAVQVFFIISGFYMQLILGDGKYGTTGEFYLSRWLRIAVPYAIVTVLVVIASGISGFVNGDFLTLAATLRHEGNGMLGSALAILTNLTIFCQDWIMFLSHEAGSDLRITLDYRDDPNPLYRYLLIPPAWSVGVELMFYCVAPLLVRQLSSLAIAAVIATSLAARACCYVRFAIDHDPWTYRFFPFELCHFCYGILACRMMQGLVSPFDRITSTTAALADRLGAWFLPLLAAFVLLLSRTQLLASQALSRTAALGGGAHALAGMLSHELSLATWVMMVPLLFSMTRSLRSDRLIGELSYPVYLVHYTTVLIVGAVLAGLRLPAAITGEVAAIVSVSVAALLQNVILQPCEDWRQRFVRKAFVRAKA
jgi:peptidoglycan/LPS O-acetylase OafA/YrhL